VFQEKRRGSGFRDLRLYMILILLLLSRLYLMIRKRRRNTDLEMTGKIFIGNQFLAVDLPYLAALGANVLENLRHLGVE
jgi:hypothetical protein